MFLNIIQFYFSTFLRRTKIKIIFTDSLYLVLKLKSHVKHLECIFLAFTIFSLNYKH